MFCLKVPHILAGEQSPVRLQSLDNISPIFIAQTKQLLDSRFPEASQLLKVISS